MIADGFSQKALNCTTFVLFRPCSILASLRNNRLSSSFVPRSFFITTRPPIPSPSPVSLLVGAYLATKTDPKEPLPISSLSLRSDHLKVGRSCKAGDDCTRFLSFKEGNLKAMWKRRLDLSNSNFPASELLPLYVNM